MRAAIVILLSALVAGCLFVSSCSESTTEIELRTLEGRVKVRIREGYSGYGVVQDPKIFLSLATEAMQPCYNWSIETTVDRNGDRIIVWLEGISVPQICATAIGPAREWRELQLEDGKYELAFVLNGEMDTYKLDISDTAIVLEPVAADFTYSDISKYWRYPENSFACVYHTSDPSAPIVVEFTDSLRNLAGVKELQLGQQFASPYLVSDHGPATPLVVKIFEYESEENFAATGELLRRFVNRQNEEQGMMSIHLVNWRAEEFMSWLMD